MSDEDFLPRIPDGLEPLSPNAGGQGSPNDVVGREAELARLHEAVTAGGALMTGERRMGKTWIATKLQEELADTVTAIYVSAETSTLELFAQRLLDELRKNRIIGKKVANWEKEVSGELKLNIGVLELTVGGKATKAVPDKAAPGLDVLDLLSSAPGGPIVLIIDEITHLCHELGAKQAGRFLHELRARRQSGGPPLVLTGSIGLHHVLHDMKPVNDLWKVTVGPLKLEDTVVLAARLLLGIGVDPTPQLVADIIRETSGIPFYMQGVVDELRYRGDLDVAATVTRCLDTNVWETKDLVDRLVDYYGAKGAKRARAILDTVAVSDEPLEPDAIRARILAYNPDMTIPRDDLIELLQKLEMDHYLVREGDGERMSSALLARIWRHERRLR